MRPVVDELLSMSMYVSWATNSKLLLGVKLSYPTYPTNQYQVDQQDGLHDKVESIL